MESVLFGVPFSEGQLVGRGRPELYWVVPPLQAALVPPHPHPVNLQAGDVLHHQPGRAVAHHFLAPRPVVHHPVGVVRPPPEGQVDVDEFQVLEQPAGGAGQKDPVLRLGGDVDESQVGDQPGSRAHLPRAGSDVDGLGSPPPRGIIISRPYSDVREGDVADISCIEPEP